MASSKNLSAPFNAVLKVSIAILLFSPASFSIEREWKSLTSFKDVRRMKLIDDTVYMATSGGLLINEVNNTAAAGLEFTNIDGLGTVDITDIIVDFSGNKWVTGMGRLLRFDYTLTEQFPFLDQNNDPIKLHTVADDGDFLWVGTEIGLVLFSKIDDGGQIQDSYTLFDSLNPSPAVFDIYLDGDTIWIATSAGLAMADKSNPVQLKSPSNWKTYDRSRYPELTADSIKRVVEFENLIYVATNSGLYSLDRTTVDTFIVVPLGQGSSFTDLKVENDSLFFYSAAVFGVVKNNDTASLSTFALPERPNTGVTNGVFRWVSLLSRGAYQNSSGVFLPYQFTGIPAGNVSDLTVAESGVITAGFVLGLGGRLVNGQWSVFGLGKEGTLVCDDPSGDAWIGTFGFGIWRVGGGAPINYDENNTTMRGNTDGVVGPTFVVAKGLLTQDNFIYVACYRALNNYPVAIGDLGNLNSMSGWDSLGAGQGITNHFVSTLDVFGRRLALGTEGIGLYECDLGPDPGNTADDNCILYDVANNFLASNTIRSVKYSPDGELWAGTNFGLSRYDFGIERFVDVLLPAGIGPDIKVLEFDTRGNLWLGADNGLARLDALDGTAEVFKTSNSGLVSNTVNNIHYDEFTGKVYVATGAGISVISSAIGPPTDDVLSVVAFPNPFIIDDPGDELEFNFSESGEISIYSMAGELVRGLQVGQRWNGRNENGENVASGVYLFVLMDDEQQMGRGKILLIRK